jgi:7,8-dihydropterin-6-yl-methyl-4-(beta-D-ribofuranosyl)aminobenzene 5'-phosphate synthase
MKLTVLLDNNTFIDRYFQGEPAVSYFIEADGLRVLFDVGYSDTFLRNAQKLHIDLLDVDYVVLSHGHSDHTWGLFPLITLFNEARNEKQAARRPRLVAHPNVLESKRADNLPEIGALFAAEKLQAFFELRFSRQPLRLSERLWFLGEVERTTAFENQQPVGQRLENGRASDDFLLDDSALVYQAPDGLVVITGCAHSGICNIIAHAQKLCNEPRILDIIGGFHLLKPSQEQLQGTIACLNAIQPRAVHACHCTDFASRVELAKTLSVVEVGVGLELVYPA